jgi:hypothetical protein
MFFWAGPVDAVDSYKVVSASGSTPNRPPTTRTPIRGSNEQHDANKQRLSKKQVHRTWEHLPALWPRDSTASIARQDRRPHPAVLLEQVPESGISFHRFCPSISTTLGGTK